MDIDDMQLDLVHQKIDAVDEHIIALKAKKKAAKSPASVLSAKTKAPAPHAKPHSE